MANTICAGLGMSLVCTSGGSVRVTIASNVGQGNGGTILACKGCRIITDGTDVRYRIGTACTAITGAPVPWYGHSTAANQTYSAYNTEFVPIDDVAKLYFYGGTDGKVVDITYYR